MEFWPYKRWPINKTQYDENIQCCFSEIEWKMATTNSVRRTLLRRALKPLPSFSLSNHFPEPSVNSPRSNLLCNSSSYRRRFSSLTDDPHLPSPIDYRSVLQEDEYNRLANSTIHDLLEKLEEYGDAVDIDGFDVDYGNEVLTLKLGSLGTYVINKQTPNRQIWMSSPVSGPSRFDWDQNAEAWIYRRTKQDLIKVLETELEKLCGEPITLS
ncbi:hypothetical protein BUALT_Bualt18G0017900 [Buddleja alternifolia]|uniref:ferroxidase n=1 Tax=Buddleja alternifolia TaxID=168488 RepID=A0AAV6WCC4_9LAMI|nr:hypothetical protein BUALT_Bualt18G0017900 [Buddleja alternifolia]